MRSPAIGAHAGLIWACHPAEVHARLTLLGSFALSAGAVVMLAVVGDGVVLDVVSGAVLVVALAVLARVAIRLAGDPGPRDPGPRSSDR